VLDQQLGEGLIRVGAQQLRVDVLRAIVRSSLIVTTLRYHVVIVHYLRWTLRGRAMRVLESAGRHDGYGWLSN
jgi:hypothetical protein